jgi:hypothetical protein
MEAKTTTEARIEFERWAKAKGFYVSRREGRLVDSSAQFAWDAWIAGWTASRGVNLMADNTIDRNTIPPSIPVPEGGFDSNEAEARWLADTITMRTDAMLATAGVNAKVAPKGLFELFLFSLNAASRRRREAAHAKA